MKIKNTRSSHVFAAVMSLAVLVPLAIVSARGSTYDTQLSRDRAIEYRSTVLSQRQELTRLNSRCVSEKSDTKDLTCKAYLIVQKECLARQGVRVQTGCPEINDLGRITEIRVALELGEEVPMLGAAPAAATGSSLKLDMDALEPSDRLAFRRMIQIGYCSSKLPQAFYLLCKETVGDRLRSAPTGLLNDIAKVQADRLKRLNELKK